jgi:hypothetical protein
VGGASATVRGREVNDFIFTRKGLPFAVHYGLIENGAQCQQNKRYRLKCEKNLPTKQTDDLDHLRLRSDGGKCMHRDGLRTMGQD